MLSITKIHIALKIGITEFFLVILLYGDFFLKTNIFYNLFFWNYNLFFKNQYFFCNLLEYFTFKL